MSLFDAPVNSMLVHACNAQGTWGSGIAAEFKKWYPEAYKNYKKVCARSFYPRTGIGRYLEKDQGEKHQVGILITSEYYGPRKDSREVIKINTTLAIQNFCELIWLREDVVYSNKFNSGLFDVPWEETELILKTVLLRYPNITWIVCDPNLT
jgi:ADP-ribose 1''-phosphate phosphatase